MRKAILDRILDHLSRISDQRRLRCSLAALPADSSLNIIRVSGFLSAYRSIFSKANSICIGMVNQLDYSHLYSDKTRQIATLMVHYLAERIALTPFHLVGTLTRDPIYSHSNVASLNRGLFESAVNICFLITEDSDYRFRQFWISSAQQELSLQKSMEKWLQSENKEIRLRAEKQSNVKDRTTELLIERMKNDLGNVGPYPKIYARCKKLGSIWEFNYDQQYRGLSSWQHGDVTRAFMAQSFVQVRPDQAERSVFESLGQCSWAWDIVYQYGLTLQSLTGDPNDLDELNNLNQFSSFTKASFLVESIRKFHRNEELRK